MSEVVKTGYKKTKLGWIPEDWEVKKLKDIGIFKNGMNKSKEDYGSGYPFVNLMDVFGRTTVKLNGLGLVETTENDLQKYGLKKGDVLFVRSSVKPSGVGLAALVDKNPDKVTYSGFLIRFREKGLLDFDFKKYCFDEPKFRHRLKCKSTISANTNINQQSLGSLRLLLPPLPEQKKIAEILSTWDRAIETLEQLIAQKEELKRGLMQQLLTGKTRFPGFEGEWEEKRLKDVTNIDSNSLSSKTKPNYEFQYISLSDVEKGQISSNLETHQFKDAPSRAKRRVQEGDILMATVRPNLRSFALAKKENHNSIASTGFAVISPKKNFNNVYLYHYLFSHHISRQIFALVVGSNYPAINSKDVKHLKILVPSTFEELNKIETVLTGISDEIEILLANKNSLIDQKKGLMQQLLTGKRRVKLWHG